MRVRNLEETDNAEEADDDDRLERSDEAIIVSVGGFLGMGAKDIALSPASFEVIYGDKSKNEVDKLRITMTKDQLKQAAAFEPYKAPSSTTGMGSTSPRPAPTPAPKAQ